MYDCFIFNAPLIKQVSVVAIFKDPRQLENFGCCDLEGIDNFTFINTEIKKRFNGEEVTLFIDKWLLQ